MFTPSERPVIFQKNFVKLLSLFHFFKTKSKAFSKDLISKVRAISTCMHPHFLVVILLLLEALVGTCPCPWACPCPCDRAPSDLEPSDMVSCGSKISCNCIYYAKYKLPSARNCAWSLSTCSRLGPCACTLRAFATPPCIPPILCQVPSSVTASISVYEYALCVSERTG